MKNFIAKIITAVCITSVLGGCAASALTENVTTASSDVNAEQNGASEITDEGTDEFVCAGAYDIYSLDPFKDTSEQYGSVFAPVFDKLLNIDGNGNINPGLIESWECSPDGLSYSFRLKDGVSFSDGSRFTVDALSAAWKYAAEECNHQDWTVIDSIERVDDLNMIVHLRKSDPEFIVNVAESAYVEPESFAKLGPEIYWNNPIGCGRYVYAGRFQGRSISFSRNDSYWGDNSTSPSDLVYMPIADDEARADALLDGRADFITDIPYERLKDVRKKKDTITERTAGTTMLWIGTQCKPQSPCSDADLRKAISLCIDRSLIAVNVCGNGYPIYADAPSYIFGKADYDAGEYFLHDQDKAREYLEQSSYDGEALRFIVPTSRFERVDEIVQTLNAMLSDIGINVEIQMLEGAAYTAARGNGEYDLCLQSHRFTAYDAKWYWQQFVYNHGKYHYDNREALDRITAAYHAADIKSCSDNMNSALRLMAEDCAPMIPLLINETNCAYESEWTGIRMYPDGRFDIRNISRK